MFNYLFILIVCRHDAYISMLILSKEFSRYNFYDCLENKQEQKLTVHFANYILNLLSVIQL